MKKRFLLLWVVALVATASAFLAHLALRFENVRLGYDVDLARREQQRLVEQQRLLSIEAATLRTPERVETVARGTLGMDMPAADEVVTVGQTQRRPSAGRMR